MKLDRCFVSKLLIIIESAFIMAWVSNFAFTDSLFCVYVLCGIIGVFCIYDNYLHVHCLSKLVNICCFLFSCVFSFISISANYRLFTPLFDLLNIFNVVSSFVGGVFLFFNVLICLYNRIPFATSEVIPHSDKDPWKVFLFVSLSVVVINCIHLFLVEYPGTLTPDSTSQMHQIATGVYSNHHPFWHTMVIKFFVDIGYALFQDYNAAVTLYFVWQILFMSFSFAYAIMTLYQMGIQRRWLIVSFLIYAFMPYNIANLISMLKDVVFGGAILFLVVSFGRIIKGIGNFKINYIIFGLSVVGACVWRSNGFIALLATALIFTIFLRKEHKKLILIMFTALAFGWTLKSPVLSALNVTQPDLVESLSIPVQQVARVIHDGHELTDEEYELLSRVLDVEEIPELYVDWLSDPIKDEIRSKDNKYFEDNIAVYLKLWINLGVRYPGTYVKAWIDQTKGYWNGGYDVVPYTTGVFDNDLGLAAGDNNNILAKVSRGIFRICRHAVFMRPFESIGLHVWLLMILCFVSFLKGRREFLLNIPALAVILTLLVATPVYSQFRYAYPVFTTFPFILPVSLYYVEKQNN